MYAMHVLNGLYVGGSCETQTKAIASVGRNLRATYGEPLPPPPQFVLSRQRYFL
jgi:hypothetical protein